MIFTNAQRLETKRASRHTGGAAKPPDGPTVGGALFSPPFLVPSFLRSFVPRFAPHAVAAAPIRRQASILSSVSPSTMLTSLSLMSRVAPRVIPSSSFIRSFSNLPSTREQADHDYAIRVQKLFDDTRPSLPRFVVQGQCIKPILQPSRFYSEMKVSLNTTETRTMDLSDLIQSLSSFLNTGTHPTSPKVDHACRSLSRTHRK